ncbi:hypothetical protein LTR01_004099 [Friedmanniomyces endolithicus]|nr:hypothetical protein LTS09_001324 [Friedmanniomyces endolithicus]KAK0309901.1 hypothetical protein LTR01_004099 [Friedmanniomyces endolithicus]KAK0826547.1 hypothetical protein LTR73_006412 [Friedmanniomyces endolithicus]
MYSLTAFLCLLFISFVINSAALPPNVQPWNDASTATGTVGIVSEIYCYTTGHDVGTNILQNTINNICNNVQTTVFGPSGYNSAKATYAFYYPPTSHDDEGVVFAAVEYHRNGLCDAAYPKGIRLAFEDCQFGFYGVVGLKGDCCGNLAGVGEDVCFMYWLDPNPELHGSRGSRSNVVDEAVSSAPGPVLTNATGLA